MKGPGQFLTSILKGLGYKAREAATHLEGHGAGIMQKYGLTEGDLYINYVGGPCPTFCRPSIPGLLPIGAKLRVHFPKPDGSVGIGVFEGGVPGFKILQ